MSVLNQGIAVNIALIPDLATEKVLRELSDELNLNGAEGLLTEGSAFPHLSLWMGLLEQEELEHLHSWVASFDLKIILHKPYLVGVPSGDGHRTLSHVCFEENDLIAYLHRTIHERMDGMRSLQELREEHFAEAGISRSSLSYCQSFHEEHSGQAFKPHVTIGYGELNRELGLDKLVFERVALFQLGNHCRCIREI